MFKYPFLLSFLLIFFSCSKTSSVASSIEVLGFDLEYKIKGQGKNMIISHPVSGSIAYEMSLKDLEDDFKILYYNPRGVGQSKAPTDIYKYTDAELIREMEELQKKLNWGKTWFFCHSDQSFTALQYCVDYPENCEGLVMAGLSYFEGFDKKMQTRRTQETNRRKQNPWFDKVCQDWDYKLTNNTDIGPNGTDISYAPLKWWCYNEESAQKVIPIYDVVNKIRRKPINGQTLPYKVKKEWLAYESRLLSYQKRFNELDIPILMLQGTHDTNNPLDLTEKLCAMFPNCTLVPIEKAGHYPWIENPEKSMKAIDAFLKNVL